MKQRTFSRAEILTIVLITLAFAMVCALAMNAYLNRDNRWFRIVSPSDDKAVEIVAVTRLLQPYVRTQEGAFYYCSGGLWDDTCEPVTEALLPINRVPPRWLSCTPELPALPPLPSSIVHSLEVGHCEEGRTYAKLVVLDDGTIWKWERTFSWVPTFALGSVIVYSLIIGALIGVFVVRLRRALVAPIPGQRPAK